MHLQFIFVNTIGRKLELLAKPTQMGLGFGDLALQAQSVVIIKGTLELRIFMESDKRFHLGCEFLPSGVTSLCTEVLSLA